jgi:hypothetical protein
LWLATLLSGPELVFVPVLDLGATDTAFVFPPDAPLVEETPSAVSGRDWFSIIWKLARGLIRIVFLGVAVLLILCVVS